MYLYYYKINNIKNQMQASLSSIFFLTFPSKKNLNCHEYFFQEYKDLENKILDLEGWRDIKEAQNMIKEYTKGFENIENKTEGLFNIK